MANEDRPDTNTNGAQVSEGTAWGDFQVTPEDLELASTIADTFPQEGQREPRAREGSAAEDIAHSRNAPWETYDAPVRAERTGGTVRQIEYSTAELRATYAKRYAPVRHDALPLQKSEAGTHDMLTQLSTRELKKADYASVHRGEEGLADNGQGMFAAGKAFAAQERERGLGQEEAAVQRERHIWVWTRNGQDADALLKGIEAEDAELTRRVHTTLAFDSPEQLEAVKRGGRFDSERTSYQLIDPDKPESWSIVPEGVRDVDLAVVPDRASELPAYRVTRTVPEHGNTLWVTHRGVQINGTDQLIIVDNKTGRAKISDIDMGAKYWSMDTTATSGPNFEPGRAAESHSMQTLLPQLQSRLTPVIGDNMGYKDIAESKYARDTGKVISQIGDLRPGVPHNISPTEPIARALVAQARTVIVSGPQRYARDNAAIPEDNLTVGQWPNIPRYVIESDTIETGALQANSKAAFTTFGLDGQECAPGAYGYALVTREPSQIAGKFSETFQNTVPASQAHKTAADSLYDSLVRAVTTNMSSEESEDTLPPGAILLASSPLPASEIMAPTANGAPPSPRHPDWARQEKVREILATRQQDWHTPPVPDAAARVVLDAYERYKQSGTLATQDRQAAILTARVLLESGSEGALAAAQDAIALAPQLSEGHLLAAKAYLRQGDWENADAAFVTARKLNPDNYEIYDTILNNMMTSSDLRNRDHNYYLHLAEYAAEWLRTSPDPHQTTLMDFATIDPETSERGQKILTLPLSVFYEMTICRSTELTWNNAKNNPSIAKVIYVDNLETGEIHKRVMLSDTMLRIKAFELYENHMAVVREQLADDPTLQDEVLKFFLNGLERTRFRASEVSTQILPTQQQDDPAPRENWPDQPPLNEHWRWAGDLYEPDSKVRDEAEALKEWARRTTIGREAAARLLSETIEKLEASGETMGLGEFIDSAGDHEVGDGLFLTLDDIAGGMLLVGRSGMGKTETYLRLFYEITNLGANVWAFDMSDKDSLSGIVDTLNAANKKFAYTVLGDPDAIPVSVDLLHPVSPKISMEAHLESFYERWVQAYGGGMTGSPIISILRSACRYEAARCGYPISMLRPDEIEEMPPRQQKLERAIAEFKVVEAPQRLQPLNISKHCVYLSEGYTGDMRSTIEYFRIRWADLGTGPIGQSFTGPNVIDWTKADTANLVFGMHKLSKGARRMWAATFIDNMAKYRQLTGKMGSTPSTLVALDEAAIVTQAVQSESDEGRASAVEGFADMRRLLREYRMSLVVADQTVRNMREEHLNQNRLIVSLGVRTESEAETVLGSMGITRDNPRFATWLRQLTNAQPGQALVSHPNLPSPQWIVVEQIERPSKEALANARANRPQMPQKPTPYANLTANQVSAALRLAQQPQAASLRLFASSLAKAGIANSERPAHLHELIRQAYKEIMGHDHIGPAAVRSIFDSAAALRAPGLTGLYPSQTLADLLNSYGNAILEEEPGAGLGQRLSAKLAHPSVVNINELNMLTHNYSKLPLDTAGIAVPQKLGPLLNANKHRHATAPGPERPQSIEDQILGLQSLPSSPLVAQGDNAKNALTALNGMDHMSRDLRDLQDVFRPMRPAELADETLRREFYTRLFRLGAALLGSTHDVFDPVRSDFEIASNVLSYLYNLAVTNGKSIR